MTVDMLEKELNSKELGSLYLFFGEERFLLDSMVKKIKKKFGELLQGINYILIDENSVDELIYDIESPAFGFDKKLIIVKNSGLFKKDGRKKSGTPLQNKICNYINENIDTINESVCLVFIENEADKNDVYSAIEKNGIVCDFEELTEANLIKRLKQIASLYKVNAPENVLSYLIQVSRNKYAILNK